MAQLNVFRSFHSELTTSEQVVYAAPASYTSVILLAQAANVTSSSSNVTLIVRDNSGGSPVDTELADAFDLAPHDSAGLLTGKLVVETGNELVAFSSDNSAVKMSISVLETLNES